MSDILSQLTQRIQFHYNNKNKLKNFMGIMEVDIQDFEQIPCAASLPGITIPQSEFEIDYLGEQLAKDILKKEWTHFCSSLPNAECEVIETNLKDMINVLDNTFDDLWDTGETLTQLFVSSKLKREIMKRKQHVVNGVHFSTGDVHTILANELGSDLIVFSNKNCFGKTYPALLEKRILVSHSRRGRNQIIDCKIVQKLQFRNLDTIKKIKITDAETLEQ